MTPMYAATLALGYILGVLSTIAVHRYRQRRRRRMPFTPPPGASDSGIFAFVRRHAVPMVLISVVLDVIFTALAVVGLQVVANLYRDVHAVQSCLNGYVSTAARLATTRDDALQTLLNDVGDHVGAKRFFADLRVEQKAYQALADYRTAHTPERGCQ